MPYAVYLVLYVGAPREHHAIFVETNSEDASGHKFHVTGNIQTGMEFGHTSEKQLEESASFLGKSYIGCIPESEFPRAQAVVEKIPAPAKQFDGPRRVDPSIPLRRCREWTEEAMQALRDEGILQA
ncbi:hypothetical protein BDU57DRAFT_536458 [Ampelomyces quisqualis]|uniref:Uncharacterized protein n=1 Tax=Ampelomyces quisqualis TaxID=50730 RepID=A0A6A5QUT7_AMPQU|nr:hypothetical protein BDU57DRAFT_536458 [Ampelomyces quisqualis]